MNYSPLQIGIPRSIRASVTYEEWLASGADAQTWYCTWKLCAQDELREDCAYMVLPDGCIDIVFDLSSESGHVFVMTPGTTATTINLGRQFSYVGIRLAPGAWQGSPVGIVGASVALQDLLAVDTASLVAQLRNTDDDAMQLLLTTFCQYLRAQHAIGPNLLIQTLLERPMISVEDLIRESGYSRRQLQRLFADRVGYTPHDFIKIIRFQRAWASQSRDGYADQPHFIREIKRITGMTPASFQGRYGNG